MRKLRLFSTYQKVTEEVQNKIKEAEEWFAASDLHNEIGEVEAENYVDFIYDAHPVRSSAFRRKIDNSTKHDLNQEHLEYLINLLTEWEYEQQNYAQSALELEQKGLPIYFLNYSLEKEFGVTFSDAKLKRFMLLRSYNRTFRIFSYHSHPKAPKNDYASLHSNMIPKFEALPDYDELEDSPEHVEIVKSIVSNQESIGLRDIQQQLKRHNIVTQDHTLIKFLQSHTLFFQPCDKRWFKVRSTTKEEFEKIEKEMEKKKKEREKKKKSMEKKKSKQKPEVRGDGNDEEDEEDAAEQEDLAESVTKLELDVQDIPDNLPSFQLPKDYKITVCNDELAIGEWVKDNILSLVVEDQIFVVGIDSEWSVIDVHPLYAMNPHWFYNIKKRYNLREAAGTKYPDLIQISTDKACLLIQTRGGKVRPPPELLEMYSNEKIAKVYCNYTSDLVYLLQWFKYHSITLKMPGLIDIDVKGIGCSKLCAIKLKKNYTKQRELQLSRWSRRKLTSDQIEYAAKDAYLNVLFYKVDPTMAVAVPDQIKKKEPKLKDTPTEIRDIVQDST
ncbi:3'-5' exonuclease [Acrasis kona]|uniref:3'-5' exonuclease n=1 Tax=Acrasis kona TaxID=1008807 RepID=A0AAW2Z8F7_9EUKA